MGLIKAITGSIGGAISDQYQEVFEADAMSDSTVMCTGVKVRANSERNQNKNGTEDIVSNGSIIHVYPNQFAMLVDGGKVVDYTGEPGYFKVNNSSAPTLLNGEFSNTLKETFSRIKYGGVPSGKQKVLFINTQEIKGIKFGTRNPVNYFDNFYNAELFLRAHGDYSIKIVEPLLFYSEAIPKDKATVDIADINSQYLSEFLSALQSAINQMSIDGIRISHVPSKGRELSQYMATTLDEEWRAKRGMEVMSVGIASLTYDEESTNLINMRNKGAMLGDPTVREGYVQGSIARGMEAAGSNSAGAGAAFMGMGFGMNAAGGFMGSASNNNMQQYKMQQEQAAAQQAQAAAGGYAAAPAADSWTCECGTANTGKFCGNCGKGKPAPVAADGWTCECGAANTGKFCGNCGKAKPAGTPKCPECGQEYPGGAPKFCGNCGHKF